MAVTGVLTKMERNQDRDSGEEAGLVPTVRPLLSINEIEISEGAMRMVPKLGAAVTGTSISIDCFAASFTSFAHETVGGRLDEGEQYFAAVDLRLYDQSYQMRCAHACCYLLSSQVFTDLGQPIWCLYPHI